MMEAITALAILIAIIGGALFCAGWTLGPLARATANSKARVHFTIADLLCLFVQIQLLMATIYQASGRMNVHSAGEVAMVVLLSFVMIGFWWFSVEFLERVGVFPGRPWETRPARGT